MRVRFLQDAVAQFPDWDDRTRSRPYVANEVADLPDSLAHRLIRANLAVECRDGTLTSLQAVRGRPQSTDSPSHIV
jgi:hypothetical protein